MSYKHLSLEERHYIEIEQQKGTSQNEIAKSLGRSQGSISRELKRNIIGNRYSHAKAHKQAHTRLCCSPKSIKLTKDIQITIDKYIRKDWSPEQISGRLKKDNIISIHHETIYQYIHRDKEKGGTLYTHLRHQKRRYKKRFNFKRNPSKIPNRIDITNRPEVVNNRERVGDWEADTIIGKGQQGAIVTLDERKSKLRLAYPLLNRKSIQTCGAITLLLGAIKTFVKTITFDNGKEFTHHEKIAKKLSCDTYFAKPYHSWERGQNENANGLLRQYFPKKMKLTNIKVEQVIDAVDKLNSRPRKCLDYKTPYEVFEELTGIDMKKIWLCTYY